MPAKGVVSICTTSQVSRKQLAEHYEHLYQDGQASQAMKNKLQADLLDRTCVAALCLMIDMQLYSFRCCIFCRHEEQAAGRLPG